MILNSPFLISSALAPALKVGAATLSLLEIKLPDDEGRDSAVFELDTPDFRYVDDKMKSGVGGFQGTVDIFVGFLNFLDYAAESDEEPPLFPEHVVEWAKENRDEIAAVTMEITDSDGGANETLIEE